MQFGGILSIGVFQFLELPGGIDVVARVDAHLLAVAGGDVGHGGVEVHVGHQRHHAAGFPDAVADDAHVLGLAHTLSGQSDQLAASLGYGQYLTDAAVGIHGRRGAHRLHANGVAAADAYLAHADLMCLSSLHIVS